MIYNLRKRIETKMVDAPFDEGNDGWSAMPSGDMPASAMPAMMMQE